VLVLLVAVSLILLTDYFGSPSSSPLHSVQRGLAEALAPVQKGASTVLSPVRDVAGWVSSTFDAKSQVKKLTNQRNSLYAKLAKAHVDEHQLEVDQALLKLDDSTGVAAYHTVTTSVIGKDLVYWYETITIGAGFGDGIKVGDPVVGPGGLVGDVSVVQSDESIVTLLTSPKFSVGATIQNQSNTQGLIQPAIRDPASLRLDDLPSTAPNILDGQEVVTSGFVEANDSFVHSLYPPGIPIGTVSGTSPQTSVQTSQTVDVTPLVDFNNLSTVQVLTKPRAGA